MKQRDRLRIYEEFFHKINVHCITMNTEKIRDAVHLIDQWSYAHRAGNGEFTPHRTQKAIDHVIKRMEDF